MMPASEIEFTGLWTKSEGVRRRSLNFWKAATHSGNSRQHARGIHRTIYDYHGKISFEISRTAERFHTGRLAEIFQITYLSESAQDNSKRFSERRSSELSENFTVLHHGVRGRNREYISLAEGLNESQ